MTVGLLLLIMFAAVAGCAALGALVARAMGVEPFVGGAVALLISGVIIVMWGLIPVLNTPVNF